ncbi:MAG: mechanosensitive ion channel [Ignavibacteriales bacterium]|nr:mechanosensitive ion channel [Ignavibacteriales bacterium]
MGDLAGEVRRIGIRASVVRTWQGAEVIVPNAQLDRGAGDELDAQRSAPAHRPARGGELWRPHSSR